MSNSKVNSMFRPGMLALLKFNGKEYVANILDCNDASQMATIGVLNSEKVIPDGAYDSEYYEVDKNWFTVDYSELRPMV